MQYVDLETLLKTDDGIRYLKEHSKVFEEKFNHFIQVASKYTDVNEKINVGGPVKDEGIINFETYINGSKKVVLSYTTSPKDRDLDCQYKEYNKIEFSLDDDGNLVVNESTGRIESKYGYDFTNTDGGVLKTNYSYQVFTPEGIELLYRGYYDQMTLRSSEQIGKKKHEVSFNNVYYNLRASINLGFNPGIKNFNGKEFRWNMIAKRPVIAEFSRSLDNLGLVREFHCMFNKQMKAIRKNEKYHLNRCTDKYNPYSIPMTFDLPPLAYREGSNNLVVNYPNEGLTSRNYRSVAKNIFISTLRGKINELLRDENELDSAKENLLNKYLRLYRIYFPNEKILEEHRKGSR